MKKKLVNLVAALIIGVTTYRLFGTEATETLTELQIANIEALTSNEFGGTQCFGLYIESTSVFDTAVRIRVCFPCGYIKYVTSATDNREC